MKGIGFSVYDYLDQEEAQEFVLMLATNGIWSKTQLMVSGESSSDAYQVLIDRTDWKRAAELAEKFRNNLEYERKKSLHVCSRCHSKLSDVLDRTKFFWWRKIMAHGLTVIKCRKCGYVWYA